ncbi:hypothetical protein ACOSQ3_020325 [Xanthoceras sorbifolium]
MHHLVFIFQYLRFCSFRLDSNFTCTKFSPSVFTFKVPNLCDNCVIHHRGVKCVSLARWGFDLSKSFWAYFVLGLGLHIQPSYSGFPGKGQTGLAYFMLLKYCHPYEP